MPTGEAITCRHELEMYRLKGEARYIAVALSRMFAGGEFTRTSATTKTTVTDLIELLNQMALLDQTDVGLRKP